MSKKENRVSVRQDAQRAALRDEQNRRIRFAATSSVSEVLESLHTTLHGLDETAVAASRSEFGSNNVTHEKKKSLVKRLTEAFVNPFTAILFFLALVSAVTDMVFPHFSVLGCTPADFDPTTAGIILTMVIISGTLRFVQESRSGNAVEEMLSICTWAECSGAVQPLTEDVRRRILKTAESLNAMGFRVLAIAQKSNPSPVGAFGVKDECEMVLIGYLAFLDPPKKSAAGAVKALKLHGVTTKILTGDSEKVTCTICRQVGLKVRNMLLGAGLCRPARRLFCVSAPLRSYVHGAGDCPEKRLYPPLRRAAVIIRQRCVVRHCLITLTRIPLDIRGQCIILFLKHRKLISLESNHGQRRTRFPVYRYSCEPLAQRDRRAVFPGTIQRNRGKGAAFYPRT